MAEQAKLRAAGEKATSMVRAIGFDAELCLHECDDRSKCQACMDICPAKAVKMPKTGASSKVTVTKSFCVDCGLCAAVCPTGAFLVMEPTVRELRRRLKQASAAAGAGGHVYLTCIESGLASEHPSVVEIPCLGALTWEMWANLMLDFPNLAVWLPGDMCGRCKAKAAESMLVDAVCKAQEVTGAEVTLVELRRELDFTDANGKLPTSADADDPFSGIGSGFGDIVRDLQHPGDDLTEEERGQQDMKKLRIRVKKELTVAEGETTPGLKDTADLNGTMTPGRVSILDAAMRFPAIADAATLEGVTVDCSKADEPAALAQLIVNACPLGAAHVNEAGELRINPVICTACGLCRDLAPEGAVTQVSTTMASLMNPAVAAE